MKFIAIIPARYESTRFPGKPLAMINDKPMIQWVYERSCLCDSVDKVIVATDDSRIEEASLAHDFFEPFAIDGAGLIGESSEPLIRGFRT